MSKSRFVHSTQKFVVSEKGAVTVDYVVLTAGLVGLGMAVAAAVAPGVTHSAREIAFAVSGDPELFFLMPTESFEETAGATSQPYWGYMFTGPEYEGWQSLNGQAFDVVHSGHLGVQAAEGDFWLDLAGSRDLTIGRTLDDAVDGQAYTLNLSAADRRGENYATVLWGGEVVGTIEPEGTTMEAFSFDLVGGAGDGSNQLVIPNAPDQGGQLP